MVKYLSLDESDETEDVDELEEVDWEKSVTEAPIQQKYDHDEPALSLDGWMDIDFEENIKARFNAGITKEEFYNDVKWWNLAIHNLQIYDEKVYRREIDEMDMSIPRNEFDFKELQGTYSRLVSLFDRLSEMKSVANSHFETFTQGYKCLKQYSIGFFTGTAQQKESSAEHLVHEFYKHSLPPKKLLSDIEETIKVVEFAATNMNRILREKEANNKINSIHNLEGMARNFDNLSNTIRTRKKVDMDGYEGSEE